MKKMVICGDSFMSPVTLPGFEGTHFSEIIAKKLNFDLISLAGGGMSNGGICIQLNTALAMDSPPDLILVNTTYPDRLEWPYNGHMDSILNDISSLDLFYTQKESLVRTYDWVNKNPKIVSYSLGSALIDSVGWSGVENCLETDKYKKEKFNALREYFMYLYNRDLKKFNDTLMLIGMFHLLHESGIPYLILKDSMDDVVKKCSFISQKNYATRDICDLKPYEPGPEYIDPGYHSDKKHQKIVAEILLEKYIPFLLK